MKVAERAKEFNKENYKTVKVYIRKDEYQEIEDHAKSNGQKMSAYIKSLIDADMKKEVGGQ